MDASSLAATGLGALPAILAAVFAYRSSSRANDMQEQTNRLAAGKVDAEAYARAQATYEKLLAENERQIEKLRDEVARLTGSLDAARREADELRGRIQTLERQR